MGELIRKSLTSAVMITGLVFVMMLVIEYLNVQTKGLWQRGLCGSLWLQYLFAALLGATPGCMGAFAVVALYSHHVVSVGAVVAAMIATSGDESFVMLSLIPETALFVFATLFLVGVAAGIVTDLLFRANVRRLAVVEHEFDLHEEESCRCFSRQEIFEQWRKCSLARGVLAFTLSLFLLSLVTGQIGPESWNWIRMTLLLTGALGLFIVTTVPDHFLEQHLWDHIAKVHVPRVFLWTFGALLLMHILIDHLHLQGWLQANPLVVLGAACLLGLIPESGPHLVFLTLYTQGAVPFSTLLASSVVQDGHGMLPLLAESRIDFVKIKAINLVVGLLVGLVGFLGSW